jgi:hypothetical protein
VSGIGRPRMPVDPSTESLLALLRRLLFRRHPSYQRPAAPSALREPQAKQTAAPAMASRWPVVRAGSTLVQRFGRIEPPIRRPLRPLAIRGCCSANGCVESAGASTRVTSYAPPTRCSIGMGVEGCAERAERELLATGERARKRTVETRETSPPRRPRSPGWPAKASPTRMSARDGSSAPTPSSTT